MRGRRISRRHRDPQRARPRAFVLVVVIRLAAATDAPHERRDAEKERDRNREFLDLIIENVPAPIFVKEAADLRYVLVNRAGENFWGIARTDMIGKAAAEPALNGRNS